METNYNLEDLVRYRPAVVALNSYKEGNDTAAKSVLEKLANTLDLGRNGPVFFKAIKEGKEGDKNIANICASEYQNLFMNVVNVKDLFEFYSNYNGLDYFKEYILGDSYDEAVRVFREYGNENYGDILNEVNEARRIIKGEKIKITDEDKKKAEETIAKYGKITTAVQNFEEDEMEKLSKPSKKEAKRKDLTEMFKPDKK
jgi:hypothetical protein